MCFFNHRNGAILIDIIDVTAHSISFFKKMNNLKQSTEYSFFKQVFQ